MPVVRMLARASTSVLRSSGRHAGRSTRVRTMSPLTCAKQADLREKRAYSPAPSPAEQSARGDGTNSA